VVASVFQNPSTALNPSLSIGSQLAEVFQLHGHSRTEAKKLACDVLERVNMPKPQAILSMYPFELSDGQQPRVVIAIAIAANPKLLIMDEPTSSLDATIEAEILNLINNLRSQYNLSILLISHNIGIVSRIYDNVVVLYAGRVVESGPTDQVLRSSKHPYTVNLISCIPRAHFNKYTRPLKPMPGSLPPLGYDTSGYVFANRCFMATDLSFRTKPDLIPISPAHFSRCIHADKVEALGNQDYDKQAPISTQTALPTASTEILRIDSLVAGYKRGYREIIVLNGISISLNRGEVLGVVGESGSGKSTLAKALVGLMPPLKGSISVLGVKLQHLDKQKRKGLQIVMQHPTSSLNPRCKVGKIVKRWIRVLGNRRATREGVTKLLAQVNLEPGIMDRLPSSLSGGQRQRVNIACAIAGNPYLVICDEPTSALDVSVEATILNLIAELQTQRGISFIVISHDLQVIRYISDRIAVMYLGEVVETFPSSKLFIPPHNPYTELLLNASVEHTLLHSSTKSDVSGEPPSITNPPSGVGSTHVALAYWATYAKK